ncbi:hypothetical protein WS73_14325 [Burkholderia savannae]|nr:hypothetical protein WS73_14325 [Burkholderia savannae]
MYRRRAARAFPALRRFGARGGACGRSAGNAGPGDAAARRIEERFAIDARAREIRAIPAVPDGFVASIDEWVVVRCGLPSFAAANGGMRRGANRRANCSTNCSANRCTNRCTNRRPTGGA